MSMSLLRWLGWGVSVAVAKELERCYPTVKLQQAWAMQSAFAVLAVRAAHGADKIVAVETGDDLSPARAHINRRYRSGVTVTPPMTNSCRPVQNAVSSLAKRR